MPSPNLHPTGDTTGPIIGTVKETVSSVRLDRFNHERNGPHTLIFGHEDSGKSTDSIFDIYHAIEYYDNLNAIILDTKNTYTSLTNTTHTSANYRADTTPHNPFTFTANTSSSKVFENTLKNGVMYLQQVLKEQGLHITPQTENLLFELVHETYRDKHISHTTPTPTTAPTFQDILSIIESFATQTGHLKRIHTLLKSHWQATHSVYNTPGFEKFSNQITRFEIPHTNASWMIGLLNEVYQYTEATDDRVLVVIDDANALLETEHTSAKTAYLKRILTAGHRTDTSYQLLTQRPKTAVQSLQPAWICDNIGYTRIYSLDSTRYATLIGLDPQHYRFLNESSTRNTGSKSVSVLYNPKTISNIPICCPQSHTDSLYITP